MYIEVKKGGLIPSYYSHLPHIHDMHTNPHRCGNYFSIYGLLFPHLSPKGVEKLLLNIRPLEKLWFLLWKIALGVDWGFIFGQGGGRVDADHADFYDGNYVVASMMVEELTQIWTDGTDFHRVWFSRMILLILLILSTISEIKNRVYNLSKANNQVVPVFRVSIPIPQQSSAFRILTRISPYRWYPGFAWFDIVAYPSN